jgi:alkylation response protein AidB-like acyl-CoA dehydrogenase
MIADMATDIAAARLLLYRAAELYDQPGRHTAEIAMAKLKCAEVAMHHTVKAVQIHGGNGYMREYGVERLMRDAKITEIYEGTSEVMRLIIAGAALR